VDKLGSDTKGSPEEVSSVLQWYVLRLKKKTQKESSITGMSLGKDVRSESRAWGELWLKTREKRRNESDLAGEGCG